jgi:hypothetical protein
MAWVRDTSCTAQELHPDDYCIGFFDDQESAPEMNEAVASGLLQYIVSAENQYKDGPGKGSYGSYQQLVEAKVLVPDSFDKYGYKFEVTASGEAFEAMGDSQEYGKERQTFVLCG